MEIIHKLNDVDIKKPIVFAIGFFDGLHKGHQEIINQAKKLAKNKSAEVGIITFSPHPLSVIFPEKKIKLLLSKQEKYKILKEYKLDLIVEIHPDIKFLNQSAENFLHKLESISNLKGIVVGENFTFGHKALGTPEFIEKNLDKKIEVKKVPLVKNINLSKNIPISSTVIRKLILSGNVSAARKLLGRPYFMINDVIHGFKRGSELLGFPTANLSYEQNRIIPMDGVYATYVYVCGKKYPSITNIGIKPTFNDNNRTIETFIFDFDDNIYGKTIELEWIERIRNEIKFKNFKELKAQIEKDVEKAKKILKK